MSRPSDWTVRLRLSALYGLLFLMSGSVLLLINYVLVDNRLPHGAVFVRRTLSTPDSPVRQVFIQGGVVGPDGAVRIQAVPAPSSSGPSGQQLLRQLSLLSDTQRVDSLHIVLVVSIIALGIMALASSGLGWLMAGRALRPIRAMTGAARVLSEENLHERLPETGPRDELRELAATFNALLGRLEGAFESQRRFVANASHELRTPLTLERAVLEVALADPGADAPSLRAACERALSIGAEQEALIEALITLARSQRGLEERRPVDLAVVAAEVLEAAGASVGDRSVSLDSDLRRAVVPGDPLLLERVAANLVDNAVRHNYPGGQVWVRTGTEGDDRVLSVSNTGPVVDPAEVDRLLQPFQRLSQERVSHAEGLGLGLSIVAAIATAHRADLRLSPREGGGLEVTVVFPAA